MASNVLSLYQKIFRRLAVVAAVVVVVFAISFESLFLEIKIAINSKMIVPAKI